MKLLTFGYENKVYTGILNETGDGVIPIYMDQQPVEDMNAMIEALPPQELIEALKKQDSPCIPLQDTVKMSPIPYPKQDIICLGINYMAHAVESARYKEEAFGGERPYAVYFSKRVNQAVPDGGGIDGHFDIVDSLDYEVELAVVIGKDTKNISREKAFDAVLGYTILNDISARNLQTAHKQWYFGKSLDDFTPIGPWIVTKDEFQNPPKLAIRSYINGEIRQDSTTDLLIFDIAHVISELSQGMTLKAGTIIAMGTPAGVGMGFTPPKFLKPGDEIICEIQGIGRITNHVK